MKGRRLWEGAGGVHGRREDGRKAAGEGDLAEGRRGKGREGATAHQRVEEEASNAE